jgi:hypothetical protein
LAIRYVARRAARLPRRPRIPVAEGVRALARIKRPDQRCLAPVWPPGDNPCTVSPPCPHLEVSRIKIRTGVDRARCRRTASRSRRRSGCGCRRPSTPRARAARIGRPANFLGRGRLLASRHFVSGLLAEPAPCKVDHVNALTPGMAVASVRIVSSLLVTRSASTSSKRCRRSRAGRHSVCTNPRDRSRRLFPPKYNRNTTETQP